MKHNCTSTFNDYPYPDLECTYEEGYLTFCIDKEDFYGKQVKVNFCPLCGEKSQGILIEDFKKNDTT